NAHGLLRPGMNAEVSIEIAARENVTAVPTAALRAMKEIPTTAAMLGIRPEEIHAALDPEADPKAIAASARSTLSIGGRTITLPEGVDRERVDALMRARQSGRELSPEERDLLRTVMSQAFGENGRPQGAPSARIGARA